ncbi:MAG TPA: hypothetical protein VF656_03840 [Pyrinomonadaceae bacterium]|jgi:hypothetical protein
MKHLARFSALLLLFLICASLVRAQGFKVETQNPPSADGTETFTSLDSRFSIALPRQISGLGSITSDTPKGKTPIGTSYNWQLQGMRFQVGHVDYSSAPHANADPKALVNVLAAEVAAATTKLGGKLVSNAETQFQGGAAREVRVEFPDNSILVNRLFAVNRQLYQVVATYKKDAKLEERVAKILDSFKALSPAEAETALRKKVEAAAPRPLPQAPFVKRPKSDAEDEGLKGKVKTVFTEAEDLSGTWSVQKRKPSSMEYYNEQGYLTKRESYDYRGNPSDITVYGYLDGDRASNTESVEYEYNPPAMMIAAPAGEAKPTYDPRYSYKFKFKYDERGNLLEKSWIGNDGKLWLRYVYNHKGNQKEELVYSADGSLNQKYVYTLDDKGNEIEEIVYETKRNTVRNKYAFTYEFDAQGNWTKRVSTRWESKDGKEGYQPYSVYYRTITYY